MRKKYNWAFCLFLAFFILSGFSPRSEGKDFCCPREVLFVPIPMPPEQEYDASFFISAARYGALREFKILDCPIEYEELSWRGRIELDKIVEAIGEVSGAQPDPQAREAFKKFLDVEYIWKGTLTLNRVDRIEKGYWEEGYLGKPNYVPQEAYGDWTLLLQLINVHFDEVVKEGRASWTGDASGSGMGAVKDLTRTVFSPIDDIIYDYEHIPWSCEVEPEKEEISVGDKMTITIKDIKDSKGRESKPWQRIVVEIEKGEITNGVKQYEEKCYAFLVGDGEVEVEYKAPEDCEESGTEKVFVYNSCDWGKEWISPLQITGSQKEIGNDEFEITCDWEGTIASTFKADAKEGETVLTQLEGSKSQSDVNWRLDVIFKLDRGNERVKIYELKSAKFTYSDVDDYTAVNAQKEIVEALVYSKEEAELRGRNLTSSECNLELFINLKKKTYKIEGILNVKNIPGKEESRFKIIVPPTGEVHDEKKSGGGAEDIQEEILIEGEFSEDDPEVLQGSEDMFEGWTSTLKLYAEALRGQISGKIRWKLERKGKH